ncbi:MAG: hypothetical protein ABIQ04_05065 [Candidatus Saccharimonadales bacterium]
MIEINLIPDVKQELIKAQRVRSTVISIAIIVGLASAGVVVLLAIWVFAVQAGRGYLADKTITDESAKLSNVPDIGNTLTIQNQLAQIGATHDAKHIDSRVFDVLTTINPEAPNSISLTKATLDSDSKTIKLEAQAQNSFSALEVYKKTILATTIQFVKDGKTQTVPLVTATSLGDQSYGEDTTGTKILRFSLTVTYSEELFSHGVQNAVIVAPGKKNVTDSFLGVPQSLFTVKAADIKGTN